MESVRRRRPDLDLTHVDDWFDKNISDAIGADASRALTLLEKHNFTFLIEDRVRFGIWERSGTGQSPKATRG